MNFLRSIFDSITDDLSEINQNKELYLAKICKIASIAIVGFSFGIMFAGSFLYPGSHEMKQRLFYGAVALIIFAAGAYLACVFETSEKNYLAKKAEKQV
jgi:hypothetical protein